MTTSPLMTPEELLAHFERGGVTTLEQFARQAAPTLTPTQVRAVRRAGQPEPAATPITPEMLRRALLEEGPPPTEQAPVPRPFRLEGTLYGPGDVTRFGGQPLHFYLDTALLEAGHLEAFPSKAALRRHLRETGQLPEDLTAALERGGVVPLHHVAGRPAEFFEHIDFGGERITLDPRHAFDDLTQRTMKVTGFLFFSWDRVSWNDEISSLRTGDEAITCFEHIHFGGRSFTVGRNTSVPWVGDFWNDRISSAIGLF